MSETKLKQIAGLMSIEKLSELIKSCAAQRVTFENSVQLAAPECVAQSIVHRNATPAMELFKVVGPHLRPTLAAFFEKFGNLAVVTDEQDKTKKKIAFFDVGAVMKKPALEWTEEYAAEVRAFHWTNAKKPPKVVSEYDIEVEARGFLNRLAKKLADPGVSVKNREVYDELYAAFLHAASRLADKALKSCTALPEDEQQKIVKDAEAAAATA